MARPPAGSATTTMIWATDEETRHTDPHPTPIAGSARHQAAGGRDPARQGTGPRHGDEPDPNPLSQPPHLPCIVAPAAHSVDRTGAERRPRPAIPLGRDSSCPFLCRTSGSGILWHGAPPRDMAHVARIPRNILSLVPRTVDKRPSTLGGQARGAPAAGAIRAPAASPRSIDHAIYVIAIAE